MDVETESESRFEIVKGSEKQFVIIVHFLVYPEREGTLCEIREGCCCFILVTVCSSLCSNINYTTDACPLPTVEDKHRLCVGNITIRNSADFYYSFQTYSTQYSQNQLEITQDTSDYTNISA